jgi:hypothetical protein
MAEDNTPLIAAISAVDAQRRRRIEAFVASMLGEAFDDDMQNRVNPEESGRGLETDTAVFYYPNLDPMMVFGPLSVKDMLRQFFRVNLPNVLPEAKEFENVPVNQLAEKALSSGMVVLFGANGVFNQVMARRIPVKLPDGGSAAEDGFQSAEHDIYHFTSPGRITPYAVGIKDAVPQLSWLASAK